MANEESNTEQYYNKYKKLVLNTSSEIKYTKLKNTYLCSDAMRHCKEMTSKYYQLGQKDNNDILFTLKVAYHDKTFKNKIKNLSSFSEFYDILVNKNQISHFPLIEDVFINDENIIFDSDFEEGNLRMAIEIIPNKEYDLIMRPEVGAEKTFTWFFFSVVVKKNLSDDNILKLNIINKAKDKNYFNGQCPVLIFDTSLNKWSRNTFNVYSMNNGLKNDNLKNEYHAYFTLTFSFNYKCKTKYYFAYCYPYTYTQLRLYLNTLNKNCYNNIVKFGKVGETYNKNNIPYIVITNFLSSESEIKQRKCIFITGRIHSGETVGSYVVQGVIDFLVNLNDPISIYLRDNFIFKIIPMMNVDGVIYGNYRFNIKGKDMNRLWFASLLNSVDECDKSSLYINNIIDMIKKTLRSRNIFLYCDFHGHSGKQNFFIYGCQKEEEKFMQIYYKKNQMFSLNDCVYKILPNKTKTSRALLKNEFGIDYSFCLESSMYSCCIGGGKNVVKKIIPFSIEKYKQIGKDFCLTLFDFINPQNNEEEVKDGNIEDEKNKDDV